MKTLKTFFFGTLIFLCNIALTNAQLPVVFEEWASENGTQNMFMEAFTVNDAAQNIYVGGATMNNNGNYDLFLCKYNDRGTLLWSQVYAGSGNGDDAASALAFGQNGEIYVTGTVYQGSTNQNDALLLKYNASGNLQWARTFNGNASDLDFGTSLYIDANNDIYVGGACSENTSNLLDFVILKYDMDGTLLWNNNWDGANLGDIAHKIGFVGGNPVLAGGSQINATKWEYALVKFNAGDGSYIGQNISNTAGTGIDQIKDLKVDASGNIYVTGCVNTTTQGTDVKTVKLSSNLSILWDMQYNYTASGNDLGNAIELDDSGNVYVTGYCTDNAFEQILTLKYNSTGTLQWERTVASPGDGNAQGADLVYSAASGLIVGGFIHNGSNTDYYTMKYSATGDSIWSITYNGIYNMDDKILDICLDDNNDIVVVGQSKQGDEYKYITVKYSEKDIIIPPDDETTGGLSYLENRGQLLNTSQQAVDGVKFYTHNGGPALFFQDDTISYVLSDSNATTGLMDYYRIDMQFIEASADMKVRSFNPQDHYSNFYLGHIPEGRARVKNFSNILYYNLFYNIDLQFSSNNRGSKYFYIVKAGGDPGDIRLNYNGADSMTVNSGDSLVLYTGIGDIVFPQAKAYQISATGSKINLSWSPDYSVNGNQLSFSLGSYNTSLPLVIEVNFGAEVASVNSIDNLEWSSFYGGDWHTQISDIAISQQNWYVYAIGSSASSDIPIITGFYSSTNIGDMDVIIKVMDTQSIVAFDTYFGGSKMDAGAAISINALGNIYITGRTYSPDFPVLNNSGNPLAYQAPNPPTLYDNDIFITVFDRLGGIIWSTNYGSPSNIELAMDIQVVPDLLSSDDIYVVGMGSNLTPLLTLPGAYNNSTIGTGLILKFNKDFERKWATLYPVEFISALTMSKNATTFITGRTSAQSSISLPVVNNDPNFSLPGPSTSDPNGSDDAFVSKFDANNALIMSQYIGGSSSDGGNDIQLDNDNNIVIVGSTSSPNFLTKDNNPQNPYDFFVSTLGASNKTDAFITRILNTSGTNPYSIIWSSYFGANNDDEATKLSIDADDNIYMVGNTKSGTTNGSTLPFPANNPLFTYINNDLLDDAGVQGDVFITAFDPDCKLFWTTYFGGSNYENVHTCAISPGNKLYLAGYTHGYIPGIPSFLNEFPDIPILGTPGNTGINYNLGNNLISPQTDYGFISRFNLNDIIIQSIPQLSQNQERIISLYPNPAFNEFSISTEKTLRNTTIRILDIQGKTIFTKYYPHLSKVHSFNISDIKPGLYFLILQSSDGSQFFSEKFIKL